MLAKQRIKARDETSLQDLITEPFPVFIINALEVIFTGKFGDSWDNVFRFLCVINQSYEDDQILLLRRKAMNFLRKIRDKYDLEKVTPEAFTSLMKDIAAFTEIKKVKSSFPQYKEGKWLKTMMVTLIDYLIDQFNSLGNMVAALNALRGIDTVPIMTTHKSKGLEFHTVVFVGLEDSAFWNYRVSPVSDNNTFFVALSRAKERILFTFCHTRPLPKGGGVQYAEAIKQIHQLIRDYEEVDIVTS
jgi:superfamily I DNA/RNA helicase